MAGAQASASPVVAHSSHAASYGAASSPVRRRRTARCRAADRDSSPCSLRVVVQEPDVVARQADTDLHFGECYHGSTGVATYVGPCAGSPATLTRTCRPLCSRLDDRLSLRLPDARARRAARPAVASVWYARGTIPYRREKVAPTGSTVAVIVLGDPIIETAGGPRAVPLHATHGFLIGPHDRPVTNEPTGETFALGIVTTPVGCRAALGLDPASVAGRVVELAEAWMPCAALRARLLAVAGAAAASVRGGRPEHPEAMLDLIVAALDDGLDLEHPGPRPVRACRPDAAREDPVRPIADIATAVGVSHRAPGPGVHADRRPVTSPPGPAAARRTAARGDRRRGSARGVGGPCRRPGLGRPVPHDPRRQAPHRVVPVGLPGGPTAFTTAEPGDESARFVPETM